MRSYSSFNNLFNRDRKVLYIVFSIVMISVFTLTVVYAALSTTLQINGNAEISAASWDIYLDNVVLNSKSSTTTKPTIVNNKTVSFTTTLSEPGDFYEFTVDVVNDGSIDAMIDSVTKTPELTAEQAKYLNYVVEYQNGESITTKQLVEQQSFVRLKVRIGFRSDISASDIPQTSEVLNLLFSLNYVQSDGQGTNIIDNGVKKVLDIVSGDLETVGSEVTIGDEHFYIISSDDTRVTMLAKYNLYVGGVYNSGWSAYGDEATGLQNSTMIGFVASGKPYYGTISFSSNEYWGSVQNRMYVYDSNSNLYSYVENYKSYLESKGVEIEEARLIKIEELEALGCSGNSCSEAPAWIYSTSYWTGSFHLSSNIYYVNTDSYLGGYSHTTSNSYGLRPVIQILLSDLND